MCLSFSLHHHQPNNPNLKSSPRQKKRDQTGYAHTLNILLPTFSPGEVESRVCWPASAVNLVTPDSLRDLVPKNKVGNNRARYQKSISGFHQAHALAREREETEADVHTFSDAHVSSDCRTGIKTRVCCQSPPVSLQGY